jgi:hypothetical protein
MANDQDIQSRIDRIYAAIGLTAKEGLSGFTVTTFKSEKVEGVSVDFSGGMPEPEIWNAATQVNHLIAHFQDHLRKWAKKDEKRTESISTTWSNSLPLKIIGDLNDREKHAGSPRDGGKSDLSPSIKNVERVARMTTPKGGGSVGLRMVGGKLQRTGTGSIAQVITGEVVDGKGERLGDLAEFQTQALSACEHLLKELGLLAS